MTLARLSEPDHQADWNPVAAGHPRIEPHIDLAFIARKCPDHPFKLIGPPPEIRILVPRDQTDIRFECPALITVELRHVVGRQSADEDRAAAFPRRRASVPRHLFGLRARGWLYDVERDVNRRTGMSKPTRWSGRR